MPQSQRTGENSQPIPHTMFLDIYWKNFKRMKCLFHFNRISVSNGSIIFTPVFNL